MFRCALSAFLILLASCTADLESSQSQQAIIGGQATNGYPAVPEITVTVAGGGAFRCSASLISPRVVLTAAHCIDIRDEPAAVAISAYFGTSRSGFGTDEDFIEEIEAESWFYLDTWDFSADDLALILLSKDSQVEPLPYNTTPLNNSHLGSPLHIIGWGNTVGTTGQVQGTGSGRKRHVTTPITGFQNNYVLNYGNTVHNTCQGDSGGPGLVTIAGQERVSSITSFGAASSQGEGCKGPSGSTRVAPYANLIGSYIAQNDVPIKPVVNITNPSDGQEVQAHFQIAFEATDNTEVERIEVSINDQFVEEVALLPPYFANAPALIDGPIKVEIRATDNRGDIGTQSINVVLDNTCDGPQDCSGNLICGDDGLCASPNFALGDDCIGNDECESGMCAAGEDETLCTAQCSPEESASCPSGFTCVSAGDSGLCWPKEESGGCSAGTSSSGAAGSMLLLMALAFLGRRRRRVSIRAFR